VVITACLKMTIWHRITIMIQRENAYLGVLDKISHVNYFVKSAESVMSEGKKGQRPISPYSLISHSLSANQPVSYLPTAPAPFPNSMVASSLSRFRQAAPPLRPHRLPRTQTPLLFPAPSRRIRSPKCPGRRSSWACLRASQR
jgi:hypothetical protein